MAKRKQQKQEEDIYRDPRDFEGRDDEYILKQVMTDIRDSETNQKPYFDKFSRYYQLYMSYIPEANKRKNGANLFIPYIFNIVETAVPKIVGAMFASRPFLSYKPVNVYNEGAVAKAKKMTRLVDYHMHSAMQILGVFVDIVKSISIYGTAISKQAWKYDTKKRVVKKQKLIMDEDTREIKERVVPVLEEITKYDAPAVTNIPLEDFFFEKFSTDIDDSPFCGYRYWLPLHELKAMERDKVVRNISDIPQTENESISDADSRINSIGMTTRSNTRKGVEIIEYWTDDWKVMIANRNTVIQCIENPYWHREKPFVKWVDTPVPNEFYGIGMGKVCESLQEELNTTRNQRIDNVSFILNRMFKILRTANIDPNQLVSRPNGYIEVDDMNDIDELEFDDVTASAYQEEEIIKTDMDVTTGVHNYDRGASTNRRETATTATIMSQGSSDRFNLKVTLLEDKSLTKFGMQIAELERQFVDKNIEFQITDDTSGAQLPMSVSPEDTDIDLVVEATGSAVDPSANKEIRQSQLIQLLNVLQNNPNVNILEILKQILEVFDIQNPEKVLNSAPQMPAQPDMQNMSGQGTGSTPETATLADIASSEMQGGTQNAQ